MDFERQIIKLGKSLGTVLPSDLVKYFELEKGNKIIISDDEDKIVIRKK